MPDMPTSSASSSTARPGCDRTTTTCRQEMPPGGRATATASRTPPRQRAWQDPRVTTATDVLDVARQQVLERGIGLHEHDILACLNLPDERLPELLQVAHDVRRRWC